MMTATPQATDSQVHNRRLLALSVLFLAAWIASAIHPVMPADWWLENLLVFILIGVLAGTRRSLPLSTASYALIWVFLCLHEWGAHHRYADVPLGEWIKPVLHTVRNEYDRIVHFAFGFLLAYPQREVLIRRAGVRGAWTYTLPVLVSLAFGAIYEILEAIAACTVSPDLGNAFLSLQGDPWDTHKDMFMGLAGATLSMALLAIWNRRKSTANYS